IMHNKFHSFSWKQFTRSHIAGIIVVMPNRSTYELVAELKKREIPFICINLHSEKVNKNVNFVNIDCHATAIDAVKYFYRQGKKNIAVVNTWEMRDDIHQFHIVEGYKQAVKTLGIKESIITHGKDMELPLELLPDFFKNNLLKIKKHDALLLTDPSLEVPLSNVLHDNNIKIPEDISIASIFSRRKTVNEITSYYSDFYDIGYQSIALLDEIFNDKNKKLRQRKIKPQLIT
ncbi:MAG: substrate-binding domain-containing protein, partial [Victivallaceae bacterium]|nr:substrate-binding domain-containing protein [Victivallaceae bacterium]